jgi:3'-5' exoribonuclease
MILGLQMVEDKIRSIAAFPPEQAIILKHLILSHHGEHEFGAVKLPMTPEAFVLHFVDDLDAKMNTLNRIVDDSRNTGATWSAYQPALQRFIFRGTLPPMELETAGDASGDSGAQQLRLWEKDPMAKPSCVDSRKTGVTKDSAPDVNETTQS